MDLSSEAPGLILGSSAAMQAMSHGEGCCGCYGCSHDGYCARHRQLFKPGGDPPPLVSCVNKQTGLTELICVACLATRQGRKCPRCMCRRGVASSLACSKCVGIDITQRGKPPRWAVGAGANAWCLTCKEADRTAKRERMQLLRLDRQADHRCPQEPYDEGGGRGSAAAIRRTFRHRLRHMRHHGRQPEDTTAMLTHLQTQTGMRPCCLRQLWRRKWRQSGAALALWESRKAPGRDADA